MRNLLYALIISMATLNLSSCCGQPEISGKWYIMSVNGDEVSISGDEVPFIEFDKEQGRAHGYTGCNIMNGMYTQEGKDLTFGNMATTMMAGPEANMQLEREVLDAINKASKVKMTSDKLQITDAEGNVLMELGKK